MTNYQWPSILEERKRLGQQKPWLGGIGHGWEKHYRVKKGDTVVHAGAFYGKFGHRASHIVGAEGKVILIEPNKYSIEVLKVMVKELDLKNVILVECAVWSEKGRMGFAIGPLRINPHLTTTTKEYCEERGMEFDVVRINTVDNILDDLGIDHVDLFVADVENAEVRMVKGMARLLSNKIVRNLTIAAYHRHPMGNYAEIDDLMRLHGYNVLPHTECCYAYVSDET